MKRVNVGLMGMGTLGTGSYKILDMNRETIAKNSGCDIRFKRILERDTTRDRGIEVPMDLFTQDPEAIFNDPEIDIVIEVLGGIEPASTFMLEAMRHGKHVITANKAAIAADYDTFINTAKENNVEFRFEASVGGGIPILNAITTVLGANQFTEILGILNGTTNYILTKMTEYGLSYDTALQEAKEKGFAEPDPTADVEGHDVANKVSVLMALAFDTYIHPDNIPTIGITGITPEAIEEAKHENCVIKLIGKAKKNEDGSLEYSVAPMKLSKDHPLASVSNEFNAIYITGNAVDELMFYGKGAGGFPTGSALMGDVIEIAKKIRMEDK